MCKLKVTQKKYGDQTQHIVINKNKHGDQILHSIITVALIFFQYYGTIAVLMGI